MALEFYQPFGILHPVPYVRPHRLLPPIAGLLAAGILALSAPARDLDEPLGISIYFLADPVVPGGGGTLPIVISNRDEMLRPAAEKRPDISAPWGRDFCPSTNTIPPCTFFPRWW